MRTNAIQILTENWNEYNFICDMKSTISLRHYVECEADSDPNFFRWLFDNPELGDFECQDESEWQEFLDRLPITFGSGELLGGVATYNADPFCIEDENVNDVLASIDTYGVEELSGDEREAALPKLDLDTDDTRSIYRAGDCLFCLS